MKKTLEQQLLENFASSLTSLWEDWNKVNHHDHTNGLSQKAVNAYRHEHPGSKLKTAVTTKPSKLKPGSKAAKRRKSFCARMSGNKGPMKKPNGKPTPKALALRRWHCESLEELYVTANQRIYEAEGDSEGLKHLTPHLARDILDQMEKEGVHAIVKSIEWGDGGAKELIAMIKRDLEQVANNVTESISPKDIHKLADSKGIKWDNEPSFLSLTKRLTGKEHLDDLDQTGLQKVKQHLEKQTMSEGWSQKYKNSINCSHPKGFSQKAHCAGKKKHNEDVTMEMTCPDCGMCQTHGSLNEIAKGQKDSNGFTKCWPGKHAEGTKKGKNGGQVRNCVPNESVKEAANAAQQAAIAIAKKKKAKMENFADGKHPEDKGDSKRLGVPTKASVSTLRKVAHQGGRKGQLAHWMANMKAGKAKHAGK